ncbi:hypothetical protein RRG08_018871 [Elysia crispata]|uniref:Uncharacterized protein n=1 Tax=Elysia crispata TaxID=231223 RepID=A0AAE1B7E9_9GAST|nr:hypothetical protein RRG08_018871 [Elysia crispata]
MPPNLYHQCYCLEVGEQRRLAETATRNINLMPVFLEIKLDFVSYNTYLTKEDQQEYVRSCVITCGLKSFLFLIWNSSVV